MDITRCLLGAYLLEKAVMRSSALFWVKFLAPLAPRRAFDVQSLEDAVVDSDEAAFVAVISHWYEASLLQLVERALVPLCSVFVFQRFAPPRHVQVAANHIHSALATELFRLVDRGAHLQEARLRLLRVDIVEVDAQDAKSVSLHAFGFEMNCGEQPSDFSSRLFAAMAFDSDGGSCANELLEFHDVRPSRRLELVQEVLAGLLNCDDVIPAVVDHIWQALRATARVPGHHEESPDRQVI